MHGFGTILRVKCSQGYCLMPHVGPGFEDMRSILEHRGTIHIYDISLVILHARLAEPCHVDKNSHQTTIFEHMKQMSMSLL